MHQHDSPRVRRRALLLPLDHGPGSPLPFTRAKGSPYPGLDRVRPKPFQQTIRHARNIAGLTTSRAGRYSRSYFCLIDPFNYISLSESLPRPGYNPSWLTGFKASTNSPTTRQHMVFGSKACGTVPTEGETWELREEPCAQF